MTFVSSAITACTGGMVSGAATMCQHATSAGSYPGNFFQATWPNTAARVTDATGGCSFLCGLQSCRVGRNGLPVELLSFGVD